jgi:hypothetical protein
MLLIRYEQSAVAEGAAGDVLGDAVLQASPVNGLSR